MSKIKASISFKEKNNEIYNILKSQNLKISSDKTSDLGQLIEFELESNNLSKIEAIFNCEGLDTMSLEINSERVFSGKRKDGKLFIDGLSNKAKNFTYYISADTEILQDIRAFGEVKKLKDPFHYPFAYKILTREIIPLNKLLEINRKYPNSLLVVKAFSNTYTLSPSLRLKLIIASGNIECEYVDDSTLPLTPKEKIFTGSVFAGMFVLTAAIVYGVVKLISLLL